MKWIKKGRIFTANGQYEWMKSYASVPIADKIHDDVYRIYFSSRDLRNYSYVGYVEIDIKDPSNIIKISERPVLYPGKLGAFDDSGAMASSLVNFQRKKYLYYIGWNQSKTIPFRWSIGLAISDDDGKSFLRYSDGPILDRNIVDPYLVTSPTVIFEEGKWKMYYTSALSCEFHDGQFSAPYHIRYAESKDGKNWERLGKVCIDFKNKQETRVSRPSIFKENNHYKMLYSYAGESYRIGLAESEDGITWERKDNEVGIDISSSGWDSEMIEYPFVFENKNNKILLYNGNNYGETGFGYAIQSL